MRQALEGVYGEREAGAMAWIAAEHVTGCERGRLMTGEQLPEAQTDRLREVLEGLLAGRPLQYLLGETEFFGLKLKVNPSVLIPRQETEELVDWIIKTRLDRDLPSGSEKAGYLDIGTGSGCIAIALKKQLPDAGVWACDVSEGALQLAGENARRNSTAVSFKQADILDAETWHDFPSFDVIVSNPPYVTTAEKELMTSNVVDHEPHLALFVENDDPLLFYRQIAAFARRKLRSGGLLFFEINESYGAETCELLRKAGFQNIELRKDLNGKDRMIKAGNSKS